jgi:hypothetical protein
MTGVEGIPGVELNADVEPAVAKDAGTVSADKLAGDPVLTATADTVDCARAAEAQHIAATRRGTPSHLVIKLLPLLRCNFRHE